MRIYLLAFFAVLFSASTANATNWYVDGKNGNDKNAGTSSATAFLTPSKATSVVQAGDTIHFLPTVTYGEISIMKSGTASAPITVQGDGVSPNLTAVTGNGTGFGIQVNQGASYVVVQNFDVQAPGAWNSIYVGSSSTHVTINSNVLHNAGHCGVSTTHADYLTITYNVVYDTSTYTSDGIFCSGISTYENNNSDSNTGIKNIIAGNVIYANTNTPEVSGGTDSDGSGIILDDLRHTQSDNVVYNGKTLIEDNLIFDNGGRGIYVYISDHAVITNNTVYFNNQDPYEGAYNPGEIMVEGGGGDVQIYNNIAYSDGLAMTSTSNHVALTVSDATDGVGSVVADYNLLYNTQGNAGYMYYGGTTTAHTNTNTVTFGSHNLWLDPQFVAPSINPSTENFLLQNTSPGRGTAYVAMAAATDITGAARPSSNIDMGAYQQATVPVCGTSNSSVVTVAPIANLCAVGTASSLTGSGPWNWTCSNAGATASCQALVPTLTISITASGDDYDGDPIMALYVNGILEGTATVTAVHSSNQWQTFTYNMLAPATLSSIAVDYTNDASGTGGDRNLYVQNISVNGVSYASTSTLASYTHWGVTQAGEAMLFTTGALTYTGIPLTGTCGGSNGAILSSAPTTNLCGVGTATSVTGSGPWAWTCKGVNNGSNASCSASKLGVSTPVAVNGTCGSSNTTTLSNAPTTGFCSTGSASSVTGSGPWAWTCSGSNGGTTSSCSANLAPTPVNGSCGASNGVTVSTTPTANLCSVGTTSSVSGSGPWSWTCGGSNGGTTASCSAPKTAVTVINGSCGVSNGLTLSSAPSVSLCLLGTATSVTGSGPWAWTCAGVNGGTTATCGANVVVTPVNGSCGASNSSSLSSKPTANLCGTGTSSTVAGSGPWSWTCTGNNGGTTASCSATLAPTPVNGTCGTSNGTTLNSAPASGLCNAGTTSTVSGSGPWSWTCGGTNGGTTSSCSASLQVVQQSVTPPVDGVCGSAMGYSKVAPSAHLCDNGTASSVSGTGPWAWTCTGSNGGVTAFCSATKVTSAAVNASCGPANGVATSSTPVINLCSKGVATTVRGSASSGWAWDCSGSYGGSDTSCSAPSSSQTQQTQPTAVNGTCGASNGTTLSSAPASGLCGTGAASSINGSGPWGWTCSGSNGGTTASCSASLAAPAPVNGSCGASNGATLSSTPTSSSLCNAGSTSSVSGSGPWGWTCSGSNGGTTASCSASLAAPAPVNGSCGASNGATLSSTPTGSLCNAGSTSSVTGSGPWGWTCSGSNGGSTASCSANLAPTPVNGSCGASNGTTLTGAPTSGLCGAGTTSSVSGSGPWSWTCGGANGGTTASCSASLQQAQAVQVQQQASSVTATSNAVNGVCGASNGGTMIKMPSGNYCSVGTATTVSGVTGVWVWTCVGSNGGATATCSANK